MQEVSQGLQRAEPGLFQQVMGWVDADGKEIRYRSVYSNSFHAMGVYPPPARVR